MKKANVKTNSWGTIIAALYIFFPLGICLMVHKVSTEKWRFKENGKAVKIIGIVLLCFVPLFLVLGLTGYLEVEEGTSVAGAVATMAIIFGALGLACYLPGRKIMDKGQKYDDYICMLPARMQISIDEIAATQKLSVKNVADDLQAMIQNGYLQDACIDPVNRMLIVKPIQKKMRNFICPHCDGRNSIEISEPMKCQYCDSVITFDI